MSEMSEFVELSQEFNREMHFFFSYEDKIRRAFCNSDYKMEDEGVKKRNLNDLFDQTKFRFLV